MTETYKCNVIMGAGANTNFSNFFFLLNANIAQLCHQAIDLNAAIKVEPDRRGRLNLLTRLAYAGLQTQQSSASWELVCSLC